MRAWSYLVMSTMWFSAGLLCVARSEDDAALLFVIFGVISTFVAVSLETKSKP
jgi:hypothetical protein